MTSQPHTQTDESHHRARKGDLALVWVVEPGAHYLGRPSDPARAGYAFGLVTRTNREGFVKAVLRDHTTARWPWAITVNAADAVSPRDKVGDVPACVRACPDLFKTVAAARDAVLAWKAAQ